MKKKLSKGQVTKEVRRILLRHQVNMSKVFFSAGLTSIYLSGELLKNDGKEFKSHVVQVLTNELLQIAMIRCELDNWIIGNDGIFFIGEDHHKKAA